MTLPDGAFTRLQPTVTLSQFVQTHSQSTHSKKIVLYLHEDRHFTQFSKDEAGNNAFHECIWSLANQDYCFYVVSESSRVMTVHIRLLWQATQDSCMVIVVKKCEPAHGMGFPFVGGSLAALLASLEE